MWYRACKTCNKKVTEAIGSGYWCEGCQKNSEECSLRYIMVVKVADASGEAWLSTFNEEAERIVGCTADELDQLKSQVRKLIIVNTCCLSSLGYETVRVFLGIVERSPYFPILKKRYRHL